ncbi:MAG: response regulator [Archangiaceae bacterium]|nr:response regulator [Archangiaceae bacterium]
MERPPGHVRGLLFVDYVRMLRRHRVDPSRLHADDVRYLTTERIEPAAWYPMVAFERFGLLILREIVGTETDAIRLWGRSRLEPIVAGWPDLLVEGDVQASIRRFHGFFHDAFDYPTVELPVVEPDRAMLEVHYGMSPAAEEAAAWQTAGFFETIVTASGGRAVNSRLQPHRWAEPGPATFELRWGLAAPLPEPAAPVRPRVLVVDDQPLVLAAMRRILQSVVEVTTASSADEALELMAAHPFDGVLSDYGMPGHDGLWLMAELARRWPRVRRVLQSADMPSEAAAALAHGVVHQLLDKPAPLDVLRAAFTTAAARP